MKEKILDILENEKTLTPMEIYHAIGLESVEDLQKLNSELETMSQNGEIHKTNKGKFGLHKNLGIFCGKLSINQKGSGFVILPMQDDIYIPKSNLNGAINNDYVECELTRTGLKPEGRIINILKRDLRNIIGTIEINNKGLPIFIPDDKSITLKFKINPSTTKECVDGSKVLVSIGKKLDNNYYDAAVLKVLGHKNDPGMDIKTIAYRYAIYDDFGPKVEEELKSIPTEVTEKDLVNRRDLTHEIIFTIDGDDTKDIDDAISLKVLDDGYLLGVHIADVTHYVKENTALGDAAFERGTSAYLADTVIPMLPHKLSNGICSLNENEVRLTMSCEMKINKKGEIVSGDIFEGYIKSRKKMTYQKVNEILVEGKVPEGYEEYKDILLKMNELAKLLQSVKDKKGYLDFEIDEPKIKQNEEGEAIDITKVDHKDGEKLIENFMIAANECVASYFGNLDIPFVYRVHDNPDPEKITDFTNIVKLFGYKIETRLTKITPLTMQKVLNELRDKPEFGILSYSLLRCMKKAIYSSNNIGHFGLASDFYCHFTSPIRRYPDLYIHRIIKTFLIKNDLSMSTINYYNANVARVAEHSSEREQAAINAERDVNDMKMAEYMEKHIGEEYDGTITSVNGFGFFVQLDNLVEGLVHVRSLTDDYYNFAPDLMALVGTHTQKQYRLGDRIHIVCTSASKENSMVDFEVKEVQSGDTKQRR